MNDNIKAGGEIHAGGGYSEGTQEAYEAFVKGRNRSLAKARINELAEQARKKPLGNSWTYRLSGEFEQKFAELIIKETLQVAKAGVEFGPSMEEAVYAYFGVEE